MKNSCIGGQAVIEGVMMKNGARYAVAVRKPDGEIAVENKECKDPANRSSFLKLPLVRGVVAFIDSLVIGMDALTLASKYYVEDEEETKFEKKLNDITHGKAEKVINGFTIFFSIILACVIFVLVPLLLSRLIEKVVTNQVLLGLIEGLIRVTIFILYIVLISRIRDIRRLFMYHGAEHKCINCIESGKELTVKNVKQASKEHKRCGTSFILNVMIISIIFFMVIRVENVFLKLGLRLLLIPVIAGISYEFTKLAGKSNSKVVNILSKPGLLMQKLTTKEPDDRMIEVGIKSVEAVFDWKEFLANYDKPEVKEEKKGAADAGSSKKADDIATPVNSVNTESKSTDETNVSSVEAADISKEKASETVKPAKTEKPAEAEKPAETERSAKAEKPAKAEKSAKAEKPAKTEKQKKAKKERKDFVEEENEKSTSEKQAEAEKNQASADKPLEIDISKLFDIKIPDVDESKPKKGWKTRHEEEPRTVAPSSVNTEDDEILAALDFMFEYNGPKTEVEISDDPNVVVTGNTENGESSEKDE